MDFKEPKIKICPLCDGEYLDGGYFIKKTVHNIFLIEEVKVKVCKHCLIKTDDKLRPNLKALLPTIQS